MDGASKPAVLPVCEETMRIALDKSFLTNALALALIAAGYFAPTYSEVVKSVGFFALSGAATNWLAVHMLFEKVPFLYGSGVIPSRFEEFKEAIKRLLMEQFFTREHIERFIEKEELEGKGFLNVEPLLRAVDYDRIYQGLVSSIMESSFGGLVQRFGGAEKLESMKAPLTERVRKVLTEMVETETFRAALRRGLNAKRLSDDIVQNIEAVIDKRLDELTPEMVKRIVQDIMRLHLGWLVVWGGVFGGAIGFAVAFI